MGAPKSEKYPLTDTVRGLVYEGCFAAAMFGRLRDLPCPVEVFSKKNA